MSSRRANPRKLRDTRTLLLARKTRGRRQPQAEDFQVTFESPKSLPMSDKELRAIEILLGTALQDLLTEDTNRTAISRKNSD